MVYCDFMKAFDVFPHGRLFQVLNSLVTWIKGFLTNRTQRIVVNCQHSSWYDVNSVIPQGSGLGLYESLWCFSTWSPLPGPQPLWSQRLSGDMDKGLSRKQNAEDCGKWPTFFLVKKRYPTGVCIRASTSCS